jgi:hypothetical protein
MGLMTLQDFQNDLKDASGRSSIESGRLNRIINNAMIEFGYAFKFPELQGLAQVTLIQGRNDYGMPTNYRAMGDAGVRIDTPQTNFGGILMPETRTEYLRNARYPSTETQGVVGFYHIYSKKFWLRPVPNGAGTFSFDYWKKITRLALPGDTSPFEDDWDDVIFRGSLYRIHMVYGEHDRMINVYNMYLGMVRSRVMAEDLEEFPEGGISYIQNQFDSIRR